MNGVPFCWRERSRRDGGLLNMFFLSWTDEESVSHLLWHHLEVPTREQFSFILLYSLPFMGDISFLIFALSFEIKFFKCLYEKLIWCSFWKCSLKFELFSVLYWAWSEILKESRVLVLSWDWVRFFIYYMGKTCW